MTSTTPKNQSQLLRHLTENPALLRHDPGGSKEPVTFAGTKGRDWGMRRADGRVCWLFGLKAFMLRFDDIGFNVLLPGGNYTLRYDYA